MKKEEIKKIVSQIIVANQELATFWKNAHGWAPSNVANLLSRSRLDWQVSLSQSLNHWVGEKNLPDGDLILAWANLGSLVEGSMKLFLSVFYEDYEKDVHAFIKKNGNLIDPDELGLERLKQFFKKQEILVDQIGFIDLVQQRRNAIHSFKNRKIGTYSEFIKALFKYLELVKEINSILPYPDQDRESD